MNRTELTKEFDRQVNTLLQKGYPQAAHQSVAEFLKHVEPLKERLGAVALLDIDLDAGQLPLAIVVKSDLVAAEKAMTLVERAGRPGVTKLYPRTPKDFQPLAELNLPNGMAYLLIQIDRGKESINLPPCEALPLIKRDQRSPLTIDEGIALVTQYPDFLKKNNCFSLLASRSPKDKRVPAIWINGEQQPNLGWCWDGNPHTWLGSASCGGRI